MNEKKLSGDEVPHKFTEWLLGIGCPSENVPFVDKIKQMCSGQYYMVWRSLMEHVHPKETIREKRFQVFFDDVQRCQTQNALNKQDPNVVIPNVLDLWHLHTELKRKVAEKEESVMKCQHELHQLMDKVSSKETQCKQSQRQVQDLQRRIWLLRHLYEELQSKKANLLETRTTADSLHCADDEIDVEAKVEKCARALGRQKGRPAGGLPTANNTSNSSFVANLDNSNMEDHISSVLRCRGDMLWAQLYERRAQLATSLDVAHATHDDIIFAHADRLTPQLILSNTAMLQCSLTLAASKHRLHAEQTQKRLVHMLTELNSDMYPDACELVVLRCERANAEARVNAIKEMLEQMTSHSGVFSVDGEIIDDDKQPAEIQIATVDKAIINKKDELNKLVDTLLTTEWKIKNVTQCLTTMFDGFRSDLPPSERDRYRGLGLDLPQEAIASLRQFCEERREKRRVELSFCLDTSDVSFNNTTGNHDLKFTDELKIYLKKFNLEKNRKLVLQSGDKIWIFQTLQESIQRLQSQWYSNDLSCSLICSPVCLSRNLQTLIEQVQLRDELEILVRNRGEKRNISNALDVSLKKEEETQTIDKIRKSLNANIIKLQTTSKALALSKEHLDIWSKNEMKKYICSNRFVDGKTYEEYEALYIESINV